MNDNIRNKFLHYSETPPDAVWPRIAAALDTPAFAQKLHDFETTPPAATWERLEQQLTQARTPVVSLRTKLFKYAMAAAVLLIVAAGSVFYFNKSTSFADRTQDTASTRNNKNTLLEEAQQPGTKYTTAQSTDEATDTRSNESEATARFDPAQVQYLSEIRIANTRLTANPETIMPKEKSVIASELPDRYMVATTPTGRVVRLPKKAYSEYACAEMLQNYQCKEKLQAIQSKMAASVAIDFTDFIDLLKNLQDNP